LQPVERVPRAQYGQVGAFPLQPSDLNTLVYPSATEDERAAVMEGLTFFTTPHRADEGAGLVANQRMCLGCHTNSFEAVTSGAPGDVVGFTPGSSPMISQVSRAVRATPTNFDHTALVLDPANPDVGGGRAAGALNPDGVFAPGILSDNPALARLDAINDTGHTAAFTIFGDFNPGTGAFNELAEFGGTVQHTRPSLAACLPDTILPVELDPNLRGGIDPATGLSPLGQRRSSGERAGPPYIGRGLMEAIFDADLVAQDDPDDRVNSASSLNVDVTFPECRSDCISGRHNENTSNQAFVGGDPLVRVGRFGLRAAGPTMLQFVIGGAQGELGFTTILSPNEPSNTLNAGRQGCVDNVPEPELPESALFSCRNLLRLTAPPEFGPDLLALLQSPNPNAPQPAGSRAAQVQRGAQLFGIDLIAFANRMIPAKAAAGRSDGLDPHAINQADRMLDCAGCHTPVFATGQSPSEVGASHLSNVWAPIFADLLLHQGPVINPERNAATPRVPLLIRRTDARGTFNTFDIQRNLADDTMPNQGLANGAEFRTPPLMGMGIMGAPFLHDARVYLSRLTVNTTPAGTVTTNRDQTNAPLIVRTLDDTILAVIEMHDLPAPDDANTTAAIRAAGGGCPVPNLTPSGTGRQGDVFYPNGAGDICPAYTSATSQANRGEARKVLRRFRGLPRSGAPDGFDQQALIEFLKQL
jgi:CxxC motif-containing protein (DUF1111 family)